MNQIKWESCSIIDKHTKLTFLEDDEAIWESNYTIWTATLRSYSSNWSLLLPFEEKFVVQDMEKSERLRIRYMNCYTRKDYSRLRLIESQKSLDEQHEQDQEYSLQTPPEHITVSFLVCLVLLYIYFISHSIWGQITWKFSIICAKWNKRHKVS